MSLQFSQPTAAHRARRHLNFFLLERSTYTQTVLTVAAIGLLGALVGDNFSGKALTSTQSTLLILSVLALVAITVGGRLLSTSLPTEALAASYRRHLLILTGAGLGIGSYSVFSILDSGEYALACLVLAIVSTSAAALLYDSFESFVVVWVELWAAALFGAQESPGRSFVLVAAIAALVLASIVYINMRAILTFLITDQERCGQAAARLEASNHHLKMFFLAANHDLAQPLTAIQFGLRSINELTAQNSPTKQHIELMLSASQTLSRLIGDIVHYEKVASGAVMADGTRTPLQEVFDRVVANTQHGARTKNIGLWCRKTTHHLQSGAFIVERIVRNLVENAIKNTNNGRVLLAVRPHGNTIRIEVWDTGVGIETASADRVFDLFYQNKGTGARPAGHGIGLTIVRTLAEKIGAEIQVKTRPGRGSVFKLILAPNTIDTTHGITPPTTAVRVRQQPRPLSWGGARLAVLEDNEILRTAICTTIAERGASFVEAATTSELLERIGDEAGMIDILLTDWNLGNETGEMAALALKRDPMFRGTWIIISGDIADTERQRMLSAGVTIIDKPFEPESLVNAVERALLQKRRSELAPERPREDS